MPNFTLADFERAITATTRIEDHGDHIKFKMETLTGWIVINMRNQPSPPIIEYEWNDISQSGNLTTARVLVAESPAVPTLDVQRFAKKTIIARVGLQSDNANLYIRKLFDALDPNHESATRIIPSDPGAKRANQQPK